jgi:PPOX class probable F420-dependent enzyme
MNANEEVYLRSSDRGFLSTAGSSGRPTVVPVCFVYDDGNIYIPIDEKPKKGATLARLSNLASNPSVAFIVDNYSQDWTKLSYLLIHGMGRVVDDEMEERRAVDLLRNKYLQYLSLRLKIHRVMAIEVKETRYWAFQPR